MIPLDELVPNYRRARDRWIDAPTLARHYETVDEAYSGSGQSLIESVKSYVECVCRTILTDYGEVVDSKQSTTGLLGAALDCLGLRKSRGASRFDRVLSAHNKLADALSEVRNHDGPIAHGKDGFLDALASHHVRLYLLTGDTILSLLLGALDGSEPNLIHTREPYERFGRFNSSIDAAVAVEAEIDDDDGTVVLGFNTRALAEGLTLRLEPSRLLYAMDRAAYVEILGALPSTFEVEPGSDLPEAKPSPEMAVATTIPVKLRVVKSYSGRYSSLKEGLKRFLAQQGLTDPDIARIRDSLLAAFDENTPLDWAVHDSLRARVLVALKRVLKTRGPKHPSPDKLAGTLLQWLVENQPDTEKKGQRLRKRNAALV